MLSESGTRLLDLRIEDMLRGSRVEQLHVRRITFREILLWNNSLLH